MTMMRRHDADQEKCNVDNDGGDNDAGDCEIRWGEDMKDAN